MAGLLLPWKISSGGGRVNKAVIDILDRNGCLKDLPTTDQLSLFAEIAGSQK